MLADTAGSTARLAVVERAADAHATQAVIFSGHVCRQHFGRRDPGGPFIKMEIAEDNLTATVHHFP